MCTISYANLVLSPKFVWCCSTWNVHNFVMRLVRIVKSWCCTTQLEYKGLILVYVPSAINSTTLKIKNCDDLPKVSQHLLAKQTCYKHTHDPTNKNMFQPSTVNATNVIHVSKIIFLSFPTFRPHSTAPSRNYKANYPKHVRSCLALNAEVRTMKY